MNNGHLQIRLRGVRVHNLKNINLDLPHHRLIAVCGVSGSGKTSLAIDTLYAEGQRRYLESFSTRTRQFVNVQEKAEADSVSGIPPAIAVTKSYGRVSGRSTIGTATEIQDFFSLLFAKIGVLYCFDCHGIVRRDNPDSVSVELASLPSGTRLIIGFAANIDSGESVVELAQRLQHAGFIRIFVRDKTINLTEPNALADLTDSQTRRLPPTSAMANAGQVLQVVVDRITAGTTPRERMIDSLATAFAHGNGKCFALIDANELKETELEGVTRLELDGKSYIRRDYHRDLVCPRCEIAYPEPQPKLFSFTSVLGACPNCEGYGSVQEFDMDLIVPDRRKSIRDGAIAPWTTPAYRHELDELLALADDYGIPVDIPFSKLSEEHLQMLWDGVPERQFGGFNGFFAWLEKRRYKLHLRVFYNRWRSQRTCEVCEGDRFNELTLAFRIADQNVAELAQKKIIDLQAWLQALSLDAYQRRVAKYVLDQIHTRLTYLCNVGLGYLTLDRSLRELSSGEAQRVALTAAIGSRLVNMLYVLDEPTAGLHLSEQDGLIDSIVQLARRGNTVVCVEHNPRIFQAADQIIEIGPEAGENGGQVTFQGELAELKKVDASVTSQFLTGKRGLYFTDNRRDAKQGAIRLTNACGRNLKQLTVEFPLGLLCAVTGVSGAGKSTLVTQTLYPAICKRLAKDGPKPLEYQDVVGLGPIEDVILVDPSPIGRSPKSNPATFTKLFDPIRAVFAETVDARTHNYTAGHFSFNAEKGRCPTCNGDGYLATDMKFLADVLVRCGDCDGTRYRKEILSVRYRGQNIAEVLEMTVRHAFGFFRGQSKIQAALRQLLEVGLDYLRLGQPATTLSSGEAQRLKLAAHLATVKKKRTLFILEEPTGGLHFADIVKLEDCFQSLLNVGHSIIVITHNLQLMKAADYIIDLGPGAADQGGQVVATGTPEQIAACTDSVTGRFLQKALLKTG